MADVARVAGVSHQTVSRVINDVPGIRPETRSRVQSAIDQLGYRRNNAARMLASSRSGLLGVVAWGSGLFGPAHVVLGLEEAAAESDYRLTVLHVQEFTAKTLRHALDELLEQAVEALVVVVPHRAMLRSVHDRDLAIPVIVAQGDLSGRPLTAAMDNVGGARAAVRHLLDLGHETVYHVAGPQDWMESIARQDGWRAELEARGRPVPPLRWGGDWSARSGYEIGRSVAGDSDVTAVFAANDQMALGLSRALHEHGRAVPGDVSVVGFDDIPESPYFTPPLTTVRQEFRALGRQVMRLAERALRGEPEPCAEPTPTRLIVRESTAPPRS
jgi:DNA-binding LacI/PurR family transcriptional regulator